MLYNLPKMFLSVESESPISFRPFEILVQYYKFEWLVTTNACTSLSHEMILPWKQICLQKLTAKNISNNTFCLITFNSKTARILFPYNSIKHKGGSFVKIFSFSEQSLKASTSLAMTHVHMDCLRVHVSNGL